MNVELCIRRAIWWQRQAEIEHRKIAAEQERLAYRGWLNYNLVKKAMRRSRIAHATVRDYMRMMEILQAHPEEERFDE